MKLKDLVGKTFKFTERCSIGMFNNSICYGIRITKKGLVFVGISYDDDNPYASLLKKDDLESITIYSFRGEDEIIIRDNSKVRQIIISEMFNMEYWNWDSFQYVEEQVGSIFKT